MVPRQAPPSPAGSIKATKFPIQGEVDISEMSDGEDVIEVPTMMPPSPPVSASYSYTSFSEIVPTTTNTLRRPMSIESNLSDSSGEEEINPPLSAAERVPEDKRWDPVPGSEGQQAPTVPAPDEQTVGEKLYDEGVADAEHDQEIQATRDQARRDNE